MLAAEWMSRAFEEIAVFNFFRFESGFAPGEKYQHRAIERLIVDETAWQALVGGFIEVYEISYSGGPTRRRPRS